MESDKFCKICWKLIEAPASWKRKFQLHFPHGEFPTTSTSSGSAPGDAARSRPPPRGPRADAAAVAAAPACRVPDAGLSGGVPPAAAPSGGACVLGRRAGDQDPVEPVPGARRGRLRAARPRRRGPTASGTAGGPRRARGHGPHPQQPRRAPRGDPAAALRRHGTAARPAAAVREDAARRVPRGRRGARRPGGARRPRPRPDPRRGRRARGGAGVRVLPGPPCPLRAPRGRRRGGGRPARGWRIRDRGDRRGRRGRRRHHREAPLLGLDRRRRRR